MIMRHRRLASCLALALASGCGGLVGGPQQHVGTDSITPSATYTLTRAGSGKCLDVSAAGTSDGTKIQQYSCNSTAAQEFRVESVVGGAVRLVNPSAGKCVDVTGAGTSDGTKVQLYTCNGTVAQSWLIEDVGGGYSRVRNPSSGKCLDIAGASNADAAQGQIYSCNGTVAQSWQFNRVGGGGGGGGGGGPCPPSWTVTDDCGGPVSGNAPDFGPNVIIFDPSQSSATIQSRIDAIYEPQHTAEFGGNRYALLFKPGTYDNDVKVGFYTQVLGLGQSPDAVWINGAVRAKADYLPNNNATCNFWRGAENVAVAPSGNIDGGTNIWAVSQGTQLRRMHVAGNLALSDNGWSSGGFISDSLIDGTVESGSQQQFLTRNDDQNWRGQNWNMVFVGDGDPPGGSWPNPPYTVVADTPVVREKPFLYLDGNGNYLVMVPALTRNTRGHSWSIGAPPGSPLSIDRFFVAHPGDTAATLNGALAQGKHLLFTPGRYDIAASLNVTQPSTVILGLGLATLSATQGNAIFSVADVDGVTIAGLILEAGGASSPTLLALGNAGSHADHAANPSALFDLHCRVGGAIAGTAANCVTIDSNDVLLDNLWLWRADHGAGADWYTNQSNNGLIVNGDNVTAYGLFVEHFQQYQTLWNGNGGAVYLYQSEMPYDPPSQDAWNAPGESGYPSYKVADGVTTHIGRGIGVYSVFHNYITASNAIESPWASGVSLSHMVSVSLASGQILDIVDGTGGSVGNGRQTSFSSY